MILTGTPARYLHVVWVRVKVFTIWNMKTPLLHLMN